MPPPPLPKCSVKCFTIASNHFVVCDGKSTQRNCRSVGMSNVVRILENNGQIYNKCFTVAFDAPHISATIFTEYTTLLYSYTKLFWVKFVPATRTFVVAVRNTSSVAG